MFARNQTYVRAHFTRKSNYHCYSDVAQKTIRITRECHSQRPQEEAQKSMKPYYVDPQEDGQQTDQLPGATGELIIKLDRTNWACVIKPGYQTIRCEKRLYGWRHKTIQNSNNTTIVSSDNFRFLVYSWYSFFLMMHFPPTAWMSVNVSVYGIKLYTNFSCFFFGR